MCLTPDRRDTECRGLGKNGCMVAHLPYRRGAPQGDVSVVITVYGRVVSCEFNSLLFWVMSTEFPDDLGVSTGGIMFYGDI